MAHHMMCGIVWLIGHTDIGHSAAYAYCMRENTSFGRNIIWGLGAQIHGYSVEKKIGA